MAITGIFDSKHFASNTPGGFCLIRDVAECPGKVFWVGNNVTGATDSTGYGLNPGAPFSTLDYAVGQCTGTAGDTIFVLPGHAEDLSAATSLTMDVASVRVIGIGSGRMKPQFSLTAAAGTWNVTAANCYIENVDIVSNFLNVVASMTVGASADGLTLKNVRFFDTSVVLGSLVGISIAALCSDVTLDGCSYYGIALTAAATDCIACAGAADRLHLKDCYLKGDFSTGILAASVAASVDVRFENLCLINMSETGKGINLHASTTGWADNVRAYLEDHAGNEKAITGAALFMTERVLQTNVVTASPFLCIAADS